LTSIARRLGALAVAGGLVVGACSGTAAAPGSSSAAAPSTGASGGTTGSIGGAACAAGSITASGSTALQPLVDKAARDYMSACGGASIQVQGGGSGTGLSQVLQGAVAIGNSDVTADSKLQAADASRLVDHVVARQGWVMVVNPGVTGVTNLTTEQAKDIWTGTVTNWKDVGGPDQQIVLVIRPASSGTRATFKQVVLGGATEANSGQTLAQDSNGAVTTAVEKTPGSTSVIGLAYYEQSKASLTALALDGVQATVDTLKDGSYKLQAFGHMYSRGQPDGLTKAFLDYMLSPRVQHTTLPSLFFAAAGQ